MRPEGAHCAGSGGREEGTGLGSTHGKDAPGCHHGKGTAAIDEQGAIQLCTEGGTNFRLKRPKAKTIVTCFQSAGERERGFTW